MYSDQIIIVAFGFLLLLCGIGFAFVKIDANTYQKDDKRFGPLSFLNMGLGYHLLGLKYFRWALVTFLLATGLVFIFYGFKLIQL